MSRHRLPPEQKRHSLFFSIPEAVYQQIIRRETESSFLDSVIMFSMLRAKMNKKDMSAEHDAVLLDEKNTLLDHLEEEVASVRRERDSIIERIKRRKQEAK